MFSNPLRSFPDAIFRVHLIVTIVTLICYVSAKNNVVADILFRVETIQGSINLDELVQSQEKNRELRK